MPERTKYNFLEGGTAPPALSPSFAVREAPAAAWRLLQPQLAGMERAAAGQVWGPFSPTGNTPHCTTGSLAGLLSETTNKAERTISHPHRRLDTWKWFRQRPWKAAEALGVGQRTVLAMICMWKIYINTEWHQCRAEHLKTDEVESSLCNAKHLNDVCTHKDLFSSAHIQPSWTVGFDLPFSCQNIAAIPQHLAFLQRNCVQLSCPHLNQSRIWVQKRLKGPSLITNMFLII